MITVLITKAIITIIIPIIKGNDKDNVPIIKGNDNDNYTHNKR